ncbi:hypothetical protein N0V87_000646 [Didymella glomerata]|uniref:Uncharacterized protein n=1 Tax=Didymella glomerata TaxID=749621 RepID=A0A9W8X7U0_9PLEO|nr:hypothetical protein N0V87_000646 [Didymella glomerata]
MFSSHALFSALSSVPFNSTLFGLSPDGTLPSVSLSISPSVSPPSLLTSHVEKVLDSAFNDSLANNTMSVGGQGGAGNTPSCSSGRSIWTVLLTIALGLLVVGICASIQELDARNADVAALEDKVAGSRRRERDSKKAARDELLKLSIEFDVLQDSKGDLQAGFDELKESMDNLQASCDDLESEHDDLQASYGDLESSHDTLLTDHKLLEQHNNATEARGQELEQKNKDLQALNTTFSQENTNLYASTYNLKRDRSSLRGLYAQTYRRNVDLEKNLKYVREMSAANAQQATRSSTDLRNAESKMAALEEQIDYYKDLIASNETLTQDAIADNQTLLTSLAALEEENARFLKASSVQERDMANKDIEIVALRCELSHQESAVSRSETAISNKDEEIFTLRQEVGLQEEAVTRLAEKNAVQEQVTKRLVEDAAEREEYIKALDNVVLFNAEKREEAEKKLAWHRLGFEEARKHGRGEVSSDEEAITEEVVAEEGGAQEAGAEEAGAEQDDDQGGLSVGGFTEDLPGGTYETSLHTGNTGGVDELVEELEQRDPNWTFEDVPSPAADAQDLAATTGSAEPESAEPESAEPESAEPESGETEASEGDFHDFSDVADDGSADEEDLNACPDFAEDASVIDADDAETLVLTNSSISSDSDFDCISLSHRDSDVDILLE